MKKYIIISLLLFIPFLAMAADHCTNPKEYTVDKRCYVTDEQKEQQPYKSVVALIKTYELVGFLRNDTYEATVCTGTIARYWHGPARNDSSDSGLYLFTAKHCTDNDGDGIPDKTLHIKLQNGDEFDVTLVKTGDYNLDHDRNVYGDWAIYRLLDNSFQESTDPVIQNIARYSGNTVPTKIPWVYADSDAITRDGRPIRLIGYGRLKIMSDKEIAEFRQQYIRALEKAGVTDLSYQNTGILDDGGVNLVQVSSDMFNKFFSDEKLKVSKCFFRNRNNLCQGWGGNSGGPMIDNSDRLVSIVTRGPNQIGGADHATIGGYRYEGEEQYKIDAGKDMHEAPGYKDGDIPVGRVYQLMNK